MKSLASRPTGASRGLAVLLSLATFAPGCAAPPVPEEARGPAPDAAWARHDFPYASRYAVVKGARMHYVEAGAGDPIVLVHGQPTWSYLWRDVIPHLAGTGRVIALDLIGFGKSDRPPLDYHLEDHVEYFHGFIEALGLEDITFVGHDWGSYLAFQYLARGSARVRALVFMEGILPPDLLRPDPGDPLAEGALEMYETIRTLNDPARQDEGRDLILERDHWIERVIPANVLRSLSVDELDAYREPFADPASRQPMLQLPREITRRPPLEEFFAYVEVLSKSELPKLMFAVRPGVTAPAAQVAWARDNLPELTVVELGPGLHYLVEDYPGEIGEGIVRWMRERGLARRESESPQGSRM